MFKVVGSKISIEIALVIASVHLIPNLYYHIYISNYNNHPNITISETLPRNSSLGIRENQFLLLQVGSLSDATGTSSVIDSNEGYLNLSSFDQGILSPALPATYRSLYFCWAQYYSLFTLSVFEVLDGDFEAVH
jgi:hypothetical protein